MPLTLSIKKCFLKYLFMGNVRRCPKRCRFNLSPGCCCSSHQREAKQAHMSKQNNPTVTKMELDSNTKKSSSQDLLSCGDGTGLHKMLLLKSKGPNATLQTERIPRSSMMDRLQSFLPQMALANEKLKLEMEKSPAGRYDIESVEDAEKVIEMDVAVFELSGSDSQSEEESSQDDDSDPEEESEVTEENLRLPGSQGRRKANIQVLEKEEA